ncbi:hypothetical protein HYT33_00100 [Candidatus Roizmanbacteria bacterium]|nr:hypothetical protein [Candidatus Roizmanbacteria bacterium]
MVQISKKKLSEEKFTKLFLLFFQVVGKKHNKNEFEAIINDLFSETERIMIIKRVTIMYLLLKNIDHRTICHVLNVSVATVAKFSILTRKSEGIAPYLVKILKKEEFARFIEDVFFTVFSPPTKYGTDWRAGWRLERQRQRRKQEGI